jgi:hypothetical protein
MLTTIARLVASILILVHFAHSTAQAGGANYEPTRPPRILTVTTDATSFYIEFRARNQVGGFGHSYVTLGTIDALGHLRQTVVAGFTPKSADDDHWGRLAIPVTGSVGVTRSDFFRRPDILFRVAISKARYHFVVGRIYSLRKTWTTYALLGRNCNDFTSEIAQSIGLRTPVITTQYSVGYLSELRTLNPQ